VAEVVKLLLLNRVHLPGRRNDPCDFSCPSRARVCGQKLMQGIVQLVVQTFEAPSQALGES